MLVADVAPRIGASDPLVPGQMTYAASWSLLVFVVIEQPVSVCRVAELRCVGWTLRPESRRNRPKGVMRR